MFIHVHPWLIYNLVMAKRASKFKLYRDCAITFFKILLRKMNTEQTLDIAAALAFHTLFSLLPLFILAMLIVHFISSYHGGDHALTAQVRDFLFSQFKLDTLPDSNLNLRGLIDEQVKHARVVFRSPITGVVGFVLLLYSASKIMLVMERSFNRIYGGVSPRSWYRRLMLYWSVLLLGPLLGAAWLLISHRILAMASGTFIRAPLVIAAEFAISWLLILLLYKVIPRAKVQMKPALVGSFFAALTWEAAKSLFGLYIRFSLGGNNWFGALAILPLFMFWVYLLWSFTLIGLQMSFIIQNFKSLSEKPNA